MGISHELNIVGLPSLPYQTTTGYQSPLYPPMTNRQLSHLPTFLQ